jgi:hypothetical protein
MILTINSVADSPMLSHNGILYSERNEKAVSPSEAMNRILLTLEMRLGWNGNWDFGTASPQP